MLDHQSKNKKKAKFVAFLLFFSVRHFRNEHESTMLVSNFVSPWWYISVTKMLILKISHQVPRKRDSSRHLVAWIWQPCIAPARLTIVKCSLTKNVSPMSHQISGFGGHGNGLFWLFLTKKGIFHLKSGHLSGEPFL